MKHIKKVLARALQDDRYGLQGRDTVTRKQRMSKKRKSYAYAVPVYNSVTGKRSHIIIEA